MNTRVKELIKYVNKDSSGKWLSFSDAEELTTLLYRDMISRIEGAKVANISDDVSYRKGYEEGIRMCSNLINGAFGHPTIPPNPEHIKYKYSEVKDF